MCFSLKLRGEEVNFVVYEFKVSFIVMFNINGVGKFIFLMGFGRGRSEYLLKNNLIYYSYVVKINISF